MEKNKKCDKCGYVPAANVGVNWKFEYKEQCFGSICDWKDIDVKEHLHQICPICGYSFSLPCSDYELKKGNQWDSTKPITHITASPAKPVSKVATYAPRPTVVPTKITSPWDVECNGCPLAKKKTVLV